MPPSYRRAHDWASIQEHAAIVERRGEADVHVETWRVRRGTVIVVVTDDRKGGLAMMSAAIAASGFDIVVAEAYRRGREDGLAPEAVALFELRRPGDTTGRAITAGDLTPIVSSLGSLFRGEAGAEKLLRRTGRTLPPGPQAAPEVTFADDDEAAILLVEARDRPGLLATITSALIEASACIVDSEIVTVDGRARDRFHLTEPNGAPLSHLRREAVTHAVLAAIERSSSAP
jgi:UTP:GlnB (protein PII) uridylyltransferase